MNINNINNKMIKTSLLIFISINNHNLQITYLSLTITYETLNLDTKFCENKIDKSMPKLLQNSPRKQKLFPLLFCICMWKTVYQHCFILFADLLLIAALLSSPFPLVNILTKAIGVPFRFNQYSPLIGICMLWMIP